MFFTLVNDETRREARNNLHSIPLLTVLGVNKREGEKSLVSDAAKLRRFGCCWFWFCVSLCPQDDDDGKKEQLVIKLFTL